METGCDLCYKSAGKLIKKDVKNRNLTLKTNIFKSHNRLRITTKSDGLSFNPSGSRLGLLIMRLNHEPAKTTNS